MLSKKFIEKFYTFEEFSAKCIKNQYLSYGGEEFLLNLYKDKNIITEQEKEIIIVVNNSTLNINYIGIKEEYRGQGILSKLHKHCFNYLKDKTVINKIELRPLTKVLTMWIYLGFSFINPNEEIRLRFSIINYLKDKNIISDSDIEEYDKLPIKTIIVKHKEVFKDGTFPKNIKDMYYKELRKEIA